tara:strand:+ start:275 stop:502 length:228 start_codon:yes stop_codon:yes gene_type:complete
MILVYYKIKDGDYEYTEFSWFSEGTHKDWQQHVIKDKWLIEEVYPQDERHIRVDYVRDITPKDLKVLTKYEIVFN